VSVDVPGLVADIGGTNARFALAQDGEIIPDSVRVLATADYASLEAALSDYLAHAGEIKVRRACLAVAGPVQGQDVRLTNHPWQFRSRALAKTFAWSDIRVINDFTAMALGVQKVPEAGLVPVCGHPDAGHGQPRVVLGPGTGFGVSALIPCGGRWLPLATEGGHVDFAPVDDLDMDVLRHLRERYERVSVERILSGKGLVELYRIHAGRTGTGPVPDSPAAITAAATTGRDELAVRVLDHFCRLVGQVAGNVVLTLGGFGGVYLCGGMLPRFADFFLHSSFRRGFENKGRMRSLLQQTPVWLVTDPHTGLRGAAQALADERTAAEGE